MGANGMGEMGWGRKWDGWIWSRDHPRDHIHPPTVSSSSPKIRKKKPFRGSVLSQHLDDAFPCTLEKGFVHFQRGSHARGKLVYGCFVH